VVAVAVAAGAVALVESHSGHASGGAARGGAGQQALSGGHGVAPGAAAAPAGGRPSSGTGHVTVAGGPAVTRSLEHGSMVAVIDEPSPGLFEEQNRSIAQGATVAVEQLNAAGGLAGHIRIKLIRQRLDGLSATALEGRLRSEAAAVLILPCDTDSQLSLAAEASQYGVLMLAPCNPDASAGGRYATYWPVGTAATDEAGGFTNFMYTLGYRDVFVVTASGSRYVELLSSDFLSAAQARGIQLDGKASISLTAPNYPELAQAIKAVHPRPSAIYTALPPPLVNRLASGLAAQGVHTIVLGSSAIETPSTLTSAGKAMENATFASYGFPRVSAAARRFAADYRRQFRREPVGSFPGLGFETMRLLEAAARKAGSAEPSAIQQALSGGLSLSGVALAERAYTAGGDHNPAGEVAISKIASGSFLPLQVTAP
jgi:ABC-type branched-subunit amino acid transport system substrate-binding protein